MNVFDFIDNMITRLNKVNVAGLENMQAILQTVRDLEQLKASITIQQPEEKAEETDNAKNNDEQGENVPG